MPAAIAAQTSHSRLMPRAISFRTAPKWRFPRTRTTPTLRFSSRWKAGMCPSNCASSRRYRLQKRRVCEVRLGEPAIPPELLVAVRREQLATQLARAFIQERAAQEKRVDSEKAKATADQQSKLVESEINVQRSLQNAHAARNEGQGERDKLTFISEGQQKQVGVLGPEATVKLRQFELMLDTIAKFANAHPDVFTAALANAQKFVPNVQVGTSGESISGMLMAILGQTLGGGSPPGTNPTQPQPAPRR